MKKVLSIILAVIMMLSVMACKEEKVTFDAQKFVQDVLDAKYHQEYAEYAKQIGVSEEEAKENMMSEFNDSLETYLSETGMMISEEQAKKYAAMEAEFRKKIQYEVHEAAEDEEGNYTVDVTVTPMDGYVMFRENFQTDLQNAVNGGATEDDYMEIFLSSVQNSMDNAIELDAVTVTMHLTFEEQENNRTYIISEEDILNFDLTAIGQK